MKGALRKVTECVSGVALDFQEDKWDIAKWSIPLEIEIPIEWTDVFFKKVRHQAQEKGQHAPNRIEGQTAHYIQARNPL